MKKWRLQEGLKIYSPFLYIIKNCHFLAVIFYFCKPNKKRQIEHNIAECN